MVSDIDLPDELMILHGDRLGEITSDAKEFYECENTAREINGVKVQTFNYGMQHNGERHPVIDSTFAYDAETGSYHQFVHELQLSGDGLLGRLSHKASITSDGERVEEDITAVPERVINAIEDYITETQ